MGDMSVTKEDWNSHENTAYADVGAQSFAYSSAFPENAKEPMPIPIHNARHDGVSVGTCAYDEKEDEQEGLEIEECGHLDVLPSPFYLGRLTKLWPQPGGPTSVKFVG